jgi:hypothetical protein
MKNFCANMNSRLDDLTKTLAEIRATNETFSYKSCKAPITPREAWELEEYDKCLADGVNVPKPKIEPYDE